MILRFPLRLLSIAALFLGALAWHVPAAHSGAPGAYPEAERPPGRAGPHPGATPTTPHACHVCRVATRLGLRMTPYFRPTVYRCLCPPPAFVHAVRPRGLITAAQLTHMRVDLSLPGTPDEERILDAAWNDGLPLELHVGAAGLGVLRLPLERTTTRLEVPGTLRTRLRGLRGRVVWGLPGHGDARARASFWIEEPHGVLRRRLEAVEQGLAREALWVRHVVRAQAWFDASYDLHALDEAKAALALRPGEPHAQVLVGLTQRVLGYQGTRDDMDAVEALLALRERLDRIPRAARGTCRLHARFPSRLRTRIAPKAGCGSAASARRVAAR